MASADPRLDALLRKLEPGIRKAFEEAIGKARRAVDIAALVEALERGDLQRAVDLLRIDDQVLYPLAESIRAAYIAGGQAVGTIIPAALEARFGFGTNPRAEEQVNRITGQLIQGIQLDSLAMTREVISEGVNDGIPPARLARQITGEGRLRTGGFLGLTTQQARSIARGREDLLSGDPDRMRRYLTLELRNKRFDATILKAISEGKPVPAAQVEAIISAHKSKALGYRGRVIAQTEARNALRAGQHEGFVQLAETLPDDRYIEETWLVTRDGRQRDSHDALGGQTIRLGEVFVSPISGAQMAYPGDGSRGAPASETVQCRCAATYRIRRRQGGGESPGG